MSRHAAPVPSPELIDHLFVTESCDTLKQFKGNGPVSWIRSNLKTCGAPGPPIPFT